MKFKVLLQSDTQPLHVATARDIEAGHVIGKALVEYYKKWRTFTYALEPEMGNL